MSQTVKDEHMMLTTKDFAKFNDFSENKNVH